MTAATHFDLIVIGAGPGGYCAAIRAAQLGMHVAVVEREAVGGVCLNWGCIPSKNLIHQAKTFTHLREVEAMGIRVNRDQLDYQRVQAASREAVATLTAGVTALMRRNKIDVIAGTARIAAPGEVIVDDTHRYTCANIIIATGSSPIEAEGFEFDDQTILSSTSLLAMTDLPKSLVVLGAGAIGCELAFVMRSFGVDVCLVEAAGQLLPTEDTEACAVLEKELRSQGVKIMLNSRAIEIQHQSAGVRIALESAGEGTSSLLAEKVLVVFGRRPNTQDLGLPEVGVDLDERGYVPVSPFGETNIAGIYAIGDVTQTPALAHVASREGEIAVEYMASPDAPPEPLDVQTIPSAVYCEPQVAGFGMRDRDVAASGRDVKKSVFHFHASGKAVATGKTAGLVKLVCDCETREILGAHIVGENATELIHELLLAKKSELLAEDLATMVHAHPTLSESVMEAATGVDGTPIHG